MAKWRGDISGRVENSIEIKVPPEKAWEMLALDRLLEWNLEFDKVNARACCSKKWNKLF